MKKEYKLAHVNIGPLDYADKIRAFSNPLINMHEDNICIIFHFDDKLLLKHVLFPYMDHTKIQRYAMQYINNHLENNQVLKQNPFEKYLKIVKKFYPNIIKLLDNIAQELSKANPNIFYKYIILPVMQYKEET